MEKRKHQRINKRFKMECSRHRSNHTQPMSCDNISHGGMRVTENTNWDVGDIVVIHFRFGGKAKAKVVRVQDSASLKRRVFGLQFLKIDKKTIKKIEKFLKKDRKKKEKQKKREEREAHGE